MSVRKVHLKIVPRRKGEIETELLAKLIYRDSEIESLCILRDKDVEKIREKVAQGWSIPEDWKAIIADRFGIALDDTPQKKVARTGSLARHAAICS